MLTPLVPFSASPESHSLVVIICFYSKSTLQSCWLTNQVLEGDHDGPCGPQGPIGGPSGPTGSYMGSKWALEASGRKKLSRFDTKLDPYP